MLFNSAGFILLFLPLVLGVYYLCSRNTGVRLAVLIAASLFFYGYWDWRLLPLLVGSVTANWLFVEIFHRTLRRSLLGWGIALNLALIGVFKYADFFADSAAGLLGWTPPRFGIVLPLGISFFTFQQISYLVDLRRGDTHRYRFRDYFLFVTFFPQLVAGPIVRHSELIHQFVSDPRRSGIWERLTRGGVLFIIGLAKKVVLADSLAAIADPAFAAVLAGANLHAADAWLGVGAFSLQIYFDFSGYSDMALGLGLLFGFTLPVNFDAPYRACDIRDFWRRWHMTLSRLLRDDLYIAFGGNRRGLRRQVMALAITMFLGGLWHGAAWTFVAWGLWHGAGLAIHVLWRRLDRPLPQPLAWGLTALFVTFGWILFRSETFDVALRMAASMLGATAAPALFTAPSPTNWELLVPAAAVALLGPTSQVAALERLEPRRSLAFAAGAVLYALVFLAGGELDHEFIYFQF